MLRAIPATLVRGGSSKGLYVHQRDLPAERGLRDAVLLAAMGSPDMRQIDGLGGAHPLTSKVAVISPSTRPDADVDYLFLQVAVDKAEVSDAQNCGNILAGVGPFAIEAGLVDAREGVTSVRIHMVNTASVAVAHVPTPGGVVAYEGDARIDGVPGTGAAIAIDFLDIAGSACGALLPTGHVVDEVNGVRVTCVDNGMPVVLMRAADFGLSGRETPAELEANAALKRRVEEIRLAVGPLMNLGNVARKTVPKMTLLSQPFEGGAVSTRTFIPHRVHEAIGVLGAVSVATGCVIAGSVGAELAEIGQTSGTLELAVEHPSGFFAVSMEIAGAGADIEVKRAALIRTARKLMKGEIYIKGDVWP
ncbi:4-oxalomesaconate tautomerase [Acidocella sp.]|uniref:4-oxalomesaconate tautomerase n=1 Tax=Acidocella sp. TaxID=50710 RepID=UPI0026307003|nr:4-oxalomesaconate tautomerase [Acidocella sp.]